MDPVSYQPHVWSQGMLPMEFSHHPSFTSPPATPMTPMTPMTPAVLNHHPFPVQYDVQPHLFSSAPPPPPPPPPPPAFPPPPDYRLFALCQHLQTYTKVSETELKRWWEDFMAEFFHDNSTLVIETDLGAGEGTRKYHLSRQWIPLYFQSLMEHGVTSVHLDLGQCISTYHQSLQELECRKATMETNHTSPHPAKVCTNGSLVVDFSLEEKPRILSWYFNILDHTEYVPRANSSAQGNEAGILENITNRGILPSTQKLLQEVGRLETNSYHQEGNHHTTSADVMHRHWEVPPLISVHSGLEVLNVPMDAVSSAGMLHPTSMGPPLTLGPPSTSAPPASTHNHTSSGNMASKTKASRNSSHSSGGSRKRTSPTPATGSAKKSQQFMLVAAEAIPLKDAAVDTLPFGLEERMITRIDNNLHHQSKNKNQAAAAASNHTPSQSSPTSSSKSSPPTTSATATTTPPTSCCPPPPPLTPTSTRSHSTSSATSKLCHLSSTSQCNGGGSAVGTGGLSHSATVKSSAELGGQGTVEMFENSWPMAVPSEGIPILNHSTALASSR